MTKWTSGTPHLIGKPDSELIVTGFVHGWEASSARGGVRGGPLPVDGLEAKGAEGVSGVGHHL